MPITKISTKIAITTFIILSPFLYVFIIGNVNDAKNSISSEKFDLIILDITLPDGNGFELCKYIKAVNDTPVIFLTAKDEEKDVVKGLDTGADDYIVKPYLFDILFLNSILFQELMLF